MQEDKWMSQINVTNLTFTYPGSYDTIFENVNLQIDTDWKLGFTARNGRGKTTFLYLLLGKYEYCGKISSNVCFEYFPYEIADKKKNTIRIVDRICPDYQLWELMRELTLLDVAEEALYRPFDTLSNGEQTKVLLAALFLKETRFLLIDEPTNHLDMEARAIVSDYLKSKRGFILVSHDRAFLDHCVDHILSINKTNIDIQKGDFSSWWRNKEMQDQYEFAENIKIKKDIARLSAAAKRTSDWSDKAEARKIGFDPAITEKSIARRSSEGAKAKKMMKRAKAIKERQRSSMEEKSKLLKNLESCDSLKLSQLEFHTKCLVELRNVSIYYDKKTVCKGVDFTIDQGDRIALCGKNGSGKSSLLKLINGEPINHTGVFRRGSQLRISYVPQDTGFLQGSLSHFARDSNIDESLFKAILNKLDFSRVQFDKNMADFSSGQKKKVLIARSLCEKAHLHIWDEPLNFIDVISRIQIEEVLLDYKPTILFVEHDRMFCENIATKVILI